MSSKQIIIINVVFDPTVYLSLRVMFIILFVKVIKGNVYFVRVAKMENGVVICTSSLVISCVEHKLLSSLGGECPLNYPSNWL